MTVSEPNPANIHIPEAAAGARAAQRLANACADEDSTQLEVLRNLTLDLRRELEIYSTGAVAPNTLTETAARCADLASLAACNVVHVPTSHVGEAVAATHLAAGAARALAAGVEAAKTLDLYAIRDARGAAWRARLAAQQVDELLEARAARA